MNEHLIEQIAEIRSLQVINLFMLQTLLESIGCDAEALISTVDDMNAAFATAFESEMRKACGIEPRTTARTPVLPKLGELENMREKAWNKVGRGRGKS